MAVSGFRVLLNSGPLPRDHNNHNLNGIWKFVRGMGSPDVTFCNNQNQKNTVMSKDERRTEQSPARLLRTARVNNAGAP